VTGVVRRELTGTQFLCACRSEEFLKIASSSHATPVESVRRSLKGALAREPWNFLLWYELAEVDLRRGKARLACRSLEHAIGLWGRRRMPPYQGTQWMENLGWCHRLVGNRASSRAAYKRAIQLAVAFERQSAGVLWTQARWDRARCLAMTDRFNESAWLIRELQKDPDGPIFEEEIQELATEMPHLAAALQRRLPR